MESGKMIEERIKEINEIYKEINSFISKLGKEKNLDPVNVYVALKIFEKILEDAMITKFKIISKEKLEEIKKDIENLIFELP
ncbi:MAG: hypothetical protein QXM27_02830 [Candidatus Pacearchaeota archaeon]